MTPDLKTILILFTIISLAGYQIYRRLNFDQGVTYNTTILLRFKNYRSFSLIGVIFGLLILLMGIWQSIGRNSAINYLGLLNGLLLIIGSVFKPSNYTALSDSGIEIDGDRIKWTNITEISENGFSFIITAKKTNHFIDYIDLENKDEFRKSFMDAIKRFNHSDSFIIKN
jgi:hypothetical protein